MPTFLTTTGTSHAIENLIKDAQHWLVLVSPYWKLSSNLHDRLKDAEHRGVQIFIVYGKEDLQAEARQKLSELKTAKVYFCENLHAKCYINEKGCIITSMNMYEFSEKTNREMGVLFETPQDDTVYNDAYAEVQSILLKATLVDLRQTLSQAAPKPTSPAPQRESAAAKLAPPVPGLTITSVASGIINGLVKTVAGRLKPEGYCIRCGAKLAHDLSKPLCSGCYASWVVYSNRDYLESYCHSCGKPNRTSYNKPECRSCYAAVVK